MLLLNLNDIMYLGEAEFVLRELLCKDLVTLVLGFLQPEVEAWDPWSGWQQVDEFDSFGNYGSVPMCPTELPLF